MDTARAVDAVIPESWRQSVKRATGSWPVGVLADRLGMTDERYAPFGAASEHGVAGVLEDVGVPRTNAVAFVRASWWLLLLAGKDVNASTVARLAERAAAWRDGYMLGQLNPLPASHAPNVNYDVC